MYRALADCISSPSFLWQHGLGSTSALLAQVKFVLIRKGATSGWQMQEPALGVRV